MFIMLTDLFNENPSSWCLSLRQAKDENIIKKNRKERLITLRIKATLRTYPLLRNTELHKSVNMRASVEK